MGEIDDEVRSAVATLNTATSVGGIQVTVSHRTFTGQDAFGDPTYAAAVSRSGIYADKHQQYHSVDGLEIQTQSRLTFLGNIACTVSDEITLPDGSKPPILEVKGPLDRTGGRYLTTVVFGQAARSARGGQ